MPTSPPQPPPLDHAQVQELFSDFRDGSLDPARTEAVRTHLHGCASCRKEYMAFADTVSSLMKLKTPAPPDFVETVQGAIRRRSRGRFFARKPPRFPLELVSLITLMIMLVVYLFLTIGEPKKVREGTSPPKAPPGAPR
ncbi:MAG TPA: zf-HC2 domain-containing protein [Polyangia bacterium]|nr:zf-HC2 domain-containing protein [Polyangia bacterium]